jgi:hypothetical protein
LTKSYSEASKVLDRAKRPHPPRGNQFPRNRLGDPGHLPEVGGACRRQVDDADGQAVKHPEPIDRSSLGPCLPPLFYRCLSNWRSFDLTGEVVASQVG